MADLPQPPRDVSPAPREIPELLGRAPDAVFLCDAGAFVLDANEEAYRSLGYGRGELVGKNVLALVEGLDDARLAEMIALMKERGVATFRARHRRRDGTTFPVETRLALLRHPGPPVVVAFARDLSAQEEAERALRASEARYERLPELLPDGVVTFGADGRITFANAAAARLAGAARPQDLVGQPVLGHVHPDSPLDVARAVEEEVALVRAALPATIQVDLALDRRAGMVRADPTHLHQVLLNLSANARDALGERGGRIAIEVAPARSGDPGAPAGLQPGAHVRLTVRDEGQGMDGATRARAFEPYLSTKPLGAGSGLGLSVVHGIAVALGGAATIESAPGRGTAISVWLPCDASPAATPAPARPAPAGRGRLLLVEDDPPVARALARMLETLGYEVAVSGDGAEALERFRRDPGAFALVLTDQTLPGLRGDELVPALLAVRADLPVLLCTGYSERVDDERARALGARALLQKPLDLPQLAEALRAALEREGLG